MDIAYFLCGTNVRFLDLSYNYITYLHISVKYCNSEVQYLNLDHNIIAAVQNDDKNNFLSMITMLGTLEILTENNVLKSGTYEDNLWMDQNLYIKDTENEEEDDNKSPVYTLLQKASLASLTVYDSQVKDIIKHCGNFNYLDLGRCFCRGYNDLWDIFQCLSPTLDIEACPQNYSIHKLEYFAQRMCHYDSCYYNVMLPFPPNLKSVILKGVMALLTNVDRLNLLKLYMRNFTTFCIHPHNSLEYLDISLWDLSQFKTLPGSYAISGFHEIKYLNIQGCQIPLSIFRLLSPDMTSLTELHMGGNIIASDNKLPTHLLQTYTCLTLLNLSNANVLGIEADAFVNHQYLSVLDLSHNHLTVSSLSSVDLSKTSIRNLNLSHNRLTAIPAPLRRQLDKMEGLDLYFGGNNFICSCKNLEFLQWVQSSTSITFHYAGDHVCTDSPGNTIHNIEVDSLHCNWYWMQPLIAVASSLALTLFGIALFVAYRKRWFISNLIFRLRERFSSPSDEQTNISYKYDALISYSSADGDRQWVHLQLVKELEEKYGFRLCVHQRDFRAGEPIVDNITKAIQFSAKLLWSCQITS